MRAAPPVDALLADGRLERVVITLLHASAGALLATWLALHAEWPLATPAWLCVLAAAAVLAAIGLRLARRALPPSPGRLRWDGQAWHSVGAVAEQPLQRLVVALDLGTWVLLQLHPVAGRVRWRVASASSAQAAWHGLRVALAAHAGVARPVAGGGAA